MRALNPNHWATREFPKFVFLTSPLMRLLLLLLWGTII